MKKLTAVIAGLFCAALLVSCGTQNVTVTGADPAEIAAVLNESVNFSEELTEVSENVLLRRYGLDSDTVKAAAGYAGTPAVVDEIAVFKTDDIEAVEEAANARIESQKTNYASYAPDEVPKLEDAAVNVLGDCVIVCVSNDTSAVVTDILSTFAEN